jgi:hypothetical protein
LTIMGFKLSPRVFVLFFLATVILALLSAYVGFRLDVGSKRIDALRRYQIEKFKAAKDKVETILVGDSSAGNAIDAGLFTELSGQYTLNLALAGSFASGSNFNFIRYFKREAPNLKNIIIMQTLDSWRRPFSKQGYFETLRYVGFPQQNSPIFPSRVEYLEYVTDVKGVGQLFRKAFSRKKPRRQVDPVSGFVLQHGERFSNGLREIHSNEWLREDMDEGNKTMFSVLDDLCSRDSINCIYVHGPIHTVLVQDSPSTIEHINRFIRSSKTIISLTKVFHYSDSQMGDSPDHVDPSIKKDVTKEYHEAIKEYLKK